MGCLVASVLSSPCEVSIHTRGVEPVMRSIEAVMQVSEDGKLTIELPEEATPGRYKVVFVLSKLLGFSNQKSQVEEDHRQAS